VNRKFLIVFIFILTNLILSSRAQINKEFIKAVLEADNYFYFEQDYEKAASLYQPLVNAHPGHLNLAAKLGMCYLNIDGKKGDALRYLKAAAANIVRNDNEYTEYGVSAPLDTYLYIAIAYQQNDSLEKAIQYFTEARKRLSGHDAFSTEYINNQIKNCKYAIEARKKPVVLETGLLIPWLADFPGATNPVISKNDSVFVFTQKQKGKTRILCSYKVSGIWRMPSDITKQLGGLERYYSNSITGDGKTLIIYMDDGRDGNIYYSLRNDSGWSKIRSLGRTINTIYWEAHGFITPDGNSLYFSSNRPGGKGELDIWVSEKDKDGRWKKPVNCGNTINTPYNENTPFFDADSKTLFFSSSGHTSLGGYDIFRSSFNRGSWSHPAGLPYPLNTSMDNTFFIYNNSDSGYITSLYDEQAGYRNIYSIKKGVTPEKRIAAEGSVTTQDDLAVDTEKTSILLTDARTGVPLRSISVHDPAAYRLVIKPGDFNIVISQISSKTDTINIRTKADTLKRERQLTDTGMYRFDVAPGDYILYIKLPGYKTDTIALNLPPDHAGSVIQINSALIPEKVYNQNFLIIRNIFFDYDKYNLDNKAIAILDMMRTILVDYPELKIEVSGYTDSRGSPEYNMKLAEKRADAVINYLAGKGISSSRLTRRAFGSSDFAALNTNTDGSDNAEGRRYNRRATFGILDPNTGVSIIKEAYVPRHLRHPSSFKFSIILVKSEEELRPNQFSNLDMAATLFINPVRMESATAYIVGEFLNKMDALKYLEYVKEKGFKDAQIITQYDIYIAQDVSPDENLLIVTEPATKVYTIQLAAARKPVNMSFFKDIEGVREIYSSDKYYRYVTGEYGSVAAARPEVASLREAGFKDAFIRNLSSIPK
jgi:outer membrane protein OmpA-like peptidoglycan-associated protein/tetratricopeptide (TPR) repeat protein